MATRKVKLTGLAYWGKVFEDNRDLTGFENALKDAGGQCTIDVDLDEESMAKLAKSKSMLKGKDSPDNEGLTRVRFKRKWEEAYAGGAPKVVKADGTVWDYDEDGSIGNGSTVEVILNVYDTSRKNIIGTRLEKVKVTNHVEYNPDEDEEEDEAPTPPKTAAKSTTKTAPKVYTVEDDDEIPF
jgi:hypothetical protein